MQMNPTAMMSQPKPKAIGWRWCVAALLCLLGLSLTGAAQTEKDDPAADFKTALRLYAADYEQLLHSRGLPDEQAIERVLVAKGWLAKPIHLEDYSAQYLATLLRDRYAPGTAVLFYFHTGEELYVWLIDTGGIRGYHHRKLAPAELAAAARQLRAALGVTQLAAARAPQQRGMADAQPKSAERPAVKQAAAQLSELLLPPPVARGLAAVKHLVVVPVLEIGTTPFPLLRPFGDDTLLVERMSVSVAPSIFDLELKLEAWDANFKRALVVGNPYLPPAPDWTFPPLPGAEQEAKAVARLLGTDALIGDAATKETIVAQAPAADLLYFATHGIASADDPLGSGFLALSGTNAADSRWSVREVQHANLRARLAVLSACQTGLGQVNSAGIVGLARSFQLAGVRRVVMSLWNVSDQATADLMQAFVKQLKTQMPAEALRQAMLEVRPRHPDPAHWASFVLYGTPR